MTASETLAVIASGIAVAKSIYELGVDVYPNAKTFIYNLITVLQSWIKGEEISDAALAEIQEQTKEMSEACHKAYVAKYNV